MVGPGGPDAPLTNGLLLIISNSSSDLTEPEGNLYGAASTQRRSRLIRFVCKVAHVGLDPAQCPGADGQYLVEQQDDEVPRVGGERTPQDEFVSQVHEIL